MVQNIAPPNAVITIQPLTTPVGSQDSPAPVLQGVPSGTLIEGFVINRDAQQNPILRTPIGDILVKSDIFLKTGSEVVIQVDAQIDSRARIISIDGLTPQDYAAKTVTTPTKGDEILNSSLLPQTRPTPVTPQSNASNAPVVLTAVLLSPNVMITEGLPPAVAHYWTQMMTGLQKDMSVMLKIIKTELPLPGDSPLQSPTQPVTTPSATQSVTKPTAITQPPVVVSAQPMTAPTVASPAPITVAPNPISAPIVTAQPVTHTPASPQLASSVPAVTTTIQSTTPQQQPIPSAPIITTVAPPQQPSERPVAPINTPSVPTATSPTPQQRAPIAPAQVPQMVAHVIGHEYGGANIIQTPVGTFKLLTAQPLPTGSKLTVEITPEIKPAVPTPVMPLLPTDLDELTFLARDWSSLREAMNIIAAQDPALATQIINTALPKPHAKLTSEMLFLFAAIKNGSPDQWFGKRAIEILDLRSPEILKRLSRDFAQLQQVFADSMPQWMSVIVPLYSDSQLQQIRMFFKHDDEGGKKGGENGQRFVIEVDLSHLGDMQFDGFVKKTERRQHFDLIVRSVRSLPKDVEQQIRTIFDQSLQATGFRGYVNFQQGIQYFVRPLESVKEALSASNNAIIA